MATMVLEASWMRALDGDAEAVDRVQRAVGGDLAAFEELYRAHLGRIFAICLRLTGDPAQAEELAQETFVRAWTKRGSFRMRAAFGTWLYRIAVNVVIESQRKAGLRSRWARSSEAREEPPTPSPTTRIDLERALAGLPEGARQVLVLYDLEGYRHREIARLLGVSQGTSKAQLHRARRLLRQRLAGHREGSVS